MHGPKCKKLKKVQVLQITCINIGLKSQNNCNKYRRHGSWCHHDQAYQSECYHPYQEVTDILHYGWQPTVKVWQKLFSDSTNFHRMTGSTCNWGLPQVYPWVLETDPYPYPWLSCCHNMLLVVVVIIKTRKMEGETVRVHCHVDVDVASSGHVAMSLLWGGRGQGRVRGGHVVIVVFIVVIVMSFHCM